MKRFAIDLSGHAPADFSTVLAGTGPAKLASLPGSGLFAFAGALVLHAGMFLLVSRLPGAHVDVHERALAVLTEFELAALPEQETTVEPFVLPEPPAPPRRARVREAPTPAAALASRDPAPQLPAAPEAAPAEPAPPAPAPLSVPVAEETGSVAVLSANAPGGSPLGSVSGVPGGVSRASQAGSASAALGAKLGVPGGIARHVQLDKRHWNCRWPAEAEYEDIHEQVVKMRVTVAANGQLERAELVGDPGYGFGAAALACARRARFVPAYDAEGQAMRAESPTIHVRFVR